MATTPLLMRVVNWDTIFERASSRRTDRCGFVCLPNNPGTTGMMNVLEEHDGAALLGIYDLLIRHLSKQRRPDPAKEPQAAELYYRDGWLTDNGKEDGRPITMQNLSRAWRRPLYEILRMVSVMSSESVGWIEVVSGCETFEYADVEGTTRSVTIDTCTVGMFQDVPTVHGENEAFEHIPAATSCTPEMLQDVSTVHGNEKQENKPEDVEPAPVIEPCTVGMFQNISTVHIKKRKEKKRTERKEAGACEKKGAVEHIPTARIGIDEAKERLTVIARKPRFAKYLTVEQWPYKLLQQLSAALDEITREDLEYVEWCYLLETTAPFFEKFFPRKSFEALIENLPAEPQKIRAARRELGMNGLHAAAGKREEPPDWRPLYEREYPNAEEWPDSFWKLTKTVRDELPALREKFKEVA